MRHIYCLAFVLIFSSQMLLAQGDFKTFPSEAEVKSAMDEAMTESDLPAIVAIAINDKNQRITYTYGNAVWTEEEAITTHDIFRIASMTKLVTSIAAMQMVEKGLIGLDDDLSTLMPEMTSIPILNDGKLLEPKVAITLRHLLSHTSGFGYRGATDKQLTEFDYTGWDYQDSPRRFEAGTEFRYGSSTNWAGKLVEKLSGLDLETYFRENITGPLGMDRTWFNLPEDLRQHVVSYGNRGGDGLGPLTEIPNRVPNNTVTDFRGDGGLFSSPEDYTTLLQCMLNYGVLGDVKLLEKSTILEMNENQIGDVSNENKGAFFNPGSCCNFEGLTTSTTKWGLAWLIDTEDKAYGRKAGTVLWGGAFNTFYYIDYKSGVSASIYSQHFPFNHEATTGLFDQFSEIIYNLSGK